MARSWAVLDTSISNRSSGLVAWANLQDGIDFTDELHANRQGGFSDRATKLYASQYARQSQVKSSPHFEVIRDVVIFASRGPKHRITGLCLV